MVYLCQTERKRQREKEKHILFLLSYIVNYEKNVVYVSGIYLENNLCTVHPVHAVQRISCYPHTYRFTMNGNGRKKHVGLKMVHLPPTYIYLHCDNDDKPLDFAMIFPCFFSVHLGAQGPSRLWPSVFQVSPRRDSR